MEPVMEKSLRQCIQDLEALKTAYNCIDVEDPCTRCLCMAGITCWARYVDNRLKDSLEMIRQGECAEVLAMNYGRLAKKEYWLSGRIRNDMMNYSDKPLTAYHVLSDFKTSADLYEVYEAAVSDMVNNLKQVKDTFDQPELYENLISDMKTLYADPYLESEYEGMKEEYPEMNLGVYFGMQVQACLEFLKSGALRDAVCTSNANMEEVEVDKLTKCLAFNYKIPEDIKELWAKLSKYVDVKENAMIVPNRSRIRSLILKHFYDMTTAQFQALFRLDMLLMLIHCDMVKQYPEMAVYLATNEDSGLFGIVNSLTRLMQQKWFKNLRADKRFDDAWIGKFVEDLLNSEHSKTLLDIWENQDKRLRLKGNIIGCLKLAGIIEGNNKDIARAVLGDDDPKVETFSIYIGEGKNKGVVVKKGTSDKSVRDWICDYVNH